MHKFGLQEGEVGGSSEVEFCRGVGLFTNFQRLMLLVGICVVMVDCMLGRVWKMGGLFFKDGSSIRSRGHLDKKG